MHEVDDELHEIKREIIESRGLVIKTNNLTNALSADIKSIAKRQQSYERRFAWNSATAYVVFVVVVFTSLKLIVDARVDALDATTKHLHDENARMKQELDDLRQVQAERGAAELEAAKFYDLAKQGKRVDLIRGWESMRNKPLSKAEAGFLSDAVDKAKADQAALLVDSRDDPGPGRRIAVGSQLGPARPARRRRSRGQQRRAVRRHTLAVRQTDPVVRHPCYERYAEHDAFRAQLY